MRQWVVDVKCFDRSKRLPGRGEKTVCSGIDEADSGVKSASADVSRLCSPSEAKVDKRQSRALPRRFQHHYVASSFY